MTIDPENIDLDALVQEMNLLQVEQEKTEARTQALSVEYNEQKKLVEKLWREKEAASREKVALQQSIREKQKAIDSAKRFQEAKIKRDELKKEFEKTSTYLDELTASAKWREFAFDHQITGAKRLAVAKRGILADKRGLGKTLTSLVWLDMIEAKRVIVIAPNDIVPQFEDEIRSWAPARKIFSLRGLNPSERSAMYPLLNMVKEFIITLNYEAWRRDKSVIDDLISAGLDTIVCDEAHKIKASDKLTARGVFQLAYRPNRCDNCDATKNFLGSWVTASGTIKDYNYMKGSMLTQCPKCREPLTSTVKNVLTMTGTPILNKPQELFSLLYLVDCTRFPAENVFLSDFTWNVGPNRWVFKTGGIDRLTKTMSEFFIQRTRDEAGIKLPPPSIKVYEITKDKVKYKKQYEAERILAQNAAIALDNVDAVHSVLYQLEIILRERQMMTWPAGITLNIKDEFGETIDRVKFDVEESQKLDEAQELLCDLLEEGERVIVFSKFKGPLKELQRRMQTTEYSTTLATGDQSEIHRRQVVQDFDLKTAPKEPRWQALFGTYDAFATGLNLNAARHMILLDDEWNPGMEDQAIGRIDRMNSKDQANVHIFRVKDSIDDFMVSLLEEKKRLNEGFNDSLDKAKLLDHLRSI